MPMKGKVKDKVHCSLFENLFMDQARVLRLYKSLHKEDKDISVDDIKIINLRNDEAFTNKQYNDLGFLVRDRLIVMVEAQSTWSVNIVIRIFLYLAESYDTYIKENKLDIYKGTKVEIPKPELYVIYTGRKNSVPESISLSEEFFQGDNSYFDVNVSVLNANNAEDIALEYILFCNIYQEQLKIHKDYKKAIEETIRICLDKNILSEYLNDKKSKVGDIMLYTLTQEYKEECIRSEGVKEGKKEGKKEGIKEGIKEGEFKVIADLYADGDITLDKAISKLNISSEEFLKKYNKYMEGKKSSSIE